MHLHADAADDDALRRAGVARATAGHPARAVSQVVPRSREYTPMAAHEGARWVFNPPDDHLVGPGTTLVPSPVGRMHVERLLAGGPAD